MDLSSEQALRESESRLKQSLAALTDGIYDYNLETKETFVSDNFYRILGYEPGEFKITDEKWDSMVHPDDLSSAYQLYHDYLNHKTSRYNAEYRMLAKDGLYKWMSCSGKIVEYNESNEPIRMLGVLANIHSRRQTEEGMKIVLEGANTLRGIDFFKYIVQNIAKLLSVKYVVIMPFIAESQKVLRSNIMWEVDHFRDIFEYEVEGSPCELVYKKKNIFFVDDNLYEKFPLDTYLGDHNIVSYYGVPFFDPDDRLKGHLYFMDDRPIELEPWIESLMNLFATSVGSEIERLIKDKKLKELNESLELKVQQRTKQLSTAIEELDMFFYRASHDIKSPLVTLEGIYKVLTEMDNPFNQSEYFQMLGKQIVSIKDLIESIIEVGSIRTHKAITAYINISQEINRVADSLPSISEISFNNTISKDLKVHTDAYLFRIIVRNVIENSIKFKNSKESECLVELASHDIDSGIAIKIKDNGCGLPKPLQKDFFSMFFRGSEDKSGIGLGLYKAKMAADKINVEIKAKCHEGKGTEVIIKFNNTLGEAKISDS